MGMKQETITINNYKGDHLGIKIVLAKDTKRNQNFAIITDINPASCCYSENIATGDILLSLNGIEIDNSNSLNSVVRCVTEERNIAIQMLIMKKGTLDGSDLIQRCIDFPCSELCEIWNEVDVKIKRRSEIADKFNQINCPPALSVKITKAISVDEMHYKFQKSLTVSIEEPISGKLLSSNQPNPKYLQKALPMTKKKKSIAQPANRQLSLTPFKDMIPSPSPHFIKRPSARDYGQNKAQSNLKQAKSCSNLTDIGDSSHTSSDTTSTSSASSPSPLFAPRKSSAPPNEIPYKPTPMPRTKHINVTRQQSIEPKEFFSLSSPANNHNESNRQKSFQKNSNHLVNPSRPELPRFPHTTSRPKDSNPTFTSLPSTEYPSKATDVYRH